MSVVPFDDHVACGGDKDTGGGNGVGFNEPDGNRDIVRGAMEGDGDGALGLEEMHGRSIVVDEGGSSDDKAREVLR